MSAHIIMGRLKEEDIVCYLENEHSLTTTPFLSPVLGGIKLMVPEPQAQRAKEILTNWDNEQVS